MRMMAKERQFFCTVGGNDKMRSAVAQVWESTYHRMDDASADHVLRILEGNNMRYTHMLQLSQVVDQTEFTLLWLQVQARQNIVLYSPPPDEGAEHS